MIEASDEHRKSILQDENRTREAIQKEDSPRFVSGGREDLSEHLSVKESSSDSDGEKGGMPPGSPVMRRPGNIIIKSQMYSPPINILGDTTIASEPSLPDAVISTDVNSALQVRRCAASRSCGCYS